MYKIYNNEIKILQFLNGGSSVFSLAKSSSFKTHPIEKDLYQGSNLTADNDDFGFLLDMSNKDIDFFKVRPLFAQEIIYKKFDYNMFMAIVLTLSMFKKYDKFLVDDSKLASLVSSSGMSIDEAKRIRKNLAILGISVLKALRLFDHNKNDFVDFDEFKKSIVGSEATTTDAIVEAFKSEKTASQLAKIFENEILEKGDKFDDIDVTGSTPAAKAVAAIKKIEEDVFQTPIEYTTPTIKEGYSLKKFYDAIKALKGIVVTPEECSKIYYKQIFTNAALYHPRYVGGNYDQLQYMLNGGSLASVVRVPHLSGYFRNQLKFVEQKLKINNKALSPKSKGDIEQIIDALDKHEDNLKKQFELLKNAHLIDSEVINLEDDAAALEKAKKSLNKHIRYSNATTDIFKTLLKTLKDELVDFKPAFKFL